MNQGIVTGGWEFVIAAYTLTSLAFLGYAVSLIARLREAKKHD